MKRLFFSAWFSGAVFVWLLVATVWTGSWTVALMAAWSAFPFTRDLKKIGGGDDV